MIEVPADLLEKMMRLSKGIKENITANLEPYVASFEKMILEDELFKNLSKIELLTCFTAFSNYTLVFIIKDLAKKYHASEERLFSGTLEALPILIKSNISETNHVNTH